MISIPEPSLCTTPSNRLSAWKFITKIRNQFWNCWNVEYLNELNVRYKWNQSSWNPTVGMLVLIKEDNLPCMHWPLARIHEVHEGSDGIVRTVTSKTSKNYMKRTVNKIAILPLYE